MLLFYCVFPVGSQFFGLLYNANSNNHTSDSETLNNGKLCKRYTLPEAIIITSYQINVILSNVHLLKFNHGWNVH